ncbi:MAG: hypothetical protein WED04_10065 [Promethearchaeati archaeon SRVP18_Atabeyarchaeia-1]
MEQEEVYFGGMTSANFKKGHMSGYGVYATSRRIIGVKKRRGVLGGWMVAGLMGGHAGTVKGDILRSAFAQAFTKDEGAKQIKELEKDKDFEVYKENISYIEIKKPGTLHRGHIKIRPTQGKEIEISMGGHEEFEHMRDLLGAFLPGAVRVEE